MPKSPYVSAIHGLALLAAGRLAEALVPLTNAAHGGSAIAFYQLGNAYRELGDFDRAADAYRQTLMLQPGHAEAEANLIPVLMRIRKYEDALEAADRLLNARPWHVPALAYKCIALTELGATGQVSALADFDRLVVSERLGPPPGYNSLAEFNGALSRVLCVEPSLEREPAAHATRLGSHTGDLANSAVPEIQTLNAMLLQVAKRRLANVGQGRHHFEVARPRLYHMNPWAVVMEEGGHQIPHIHNSGWLSGVYYVEVPDQIKPEDKEHNGWLTFGRGDGRWQRETTQIMERFVCPEPGLVVTFPSFFWHGTRPLRRATRRISYAFDIVPSYPWRPQS